MIGAPFECDFALFLSFVSWTQPAMILPQCKGFLNARTIATRMTPRFGVGGKAHWQRCTDDKAFRFESTVPFCWCYPSCSQIEIADSFCFSSCYSFVFDAVIL
ncbi:hypothetical protein BO82DRAFT_37875 [Aspergillus uvarum CBS 121591]|uniref:Uncharacterized protein n=1 Tax=Aspergillus uvarum CBS 121591 TaxID=1448315 RepID=A0A319CH53_9EURO|nr:hypothetical protein BO82DRAFT_37875 [Aspergillus uvarum CBS 121591]PYH83629.1 hypothetical protein BO82DRAFT_37875 [Aspergillus uvarum CBS 121591]